MADITATQVDANIIARIAHLYPYALLSGFTVERSHGDEVLTVRHADNAMPPLRACIDSDDDGYLRFTVFHPGACPFDDSHEFVSVRILVDPAQ